MGNFCELVSADMAVGITYAAVEDKVEELLQKCNDKIAEAYYVIGVIFPALWW